MCTTACNAMDSIDTDPDMSADQVEILKAEIRATVRTAQIILGSILAAVVAVMTTFGVIFYQQGQEQHDELVKLSQRFEDMPKPDFNMMSAIEVNTERIVTLQKIQAEHTQRMDIQGNVLNQLQERVDKLEKDGH